MEDFGVVIGRISGCIGGDWRYAEHLKVTRFRDGSLKITVTESNPRGGMDSRDSSTHSNSIVDWTIAPHEVTAKELVAQIKRAMDWGSSSILMKRSYTKLKDFDWVQTRAKGLSVKLAADALAY